MIRADDICLAILAAGGSRRFGDADKLTARLHGKMLGLHITDRLASMQFGRRIVITSDTDHRCAAGWRGAGYDIAVNAQAPQGIGSSVAVAAAAAAADGFSALLICLADMPFIPAEHIGHIVKKFQHGGGRADSIIASAAGTLRSPPALLGKAHFAQLLQLSGDRGAQSLLTHADIIAIDAAKLTDIDRPDILARLNQDYNG